MAVSAASGFSLPLCVASVMGGAMFGDNLSFISDTTIAACQGQGCQMKDKFRENFKIALPAALVSLVIILALSFGADLNGSVTHEYDLVQLIPYLIVLVGGIVGINVFVVLLLGIVSGSLIMVATGATVPTDLLANMGSGAAGMFETTMVAVLVSAICALIREHGGFVALLNGIKSLFKSRKGGQLGMGLLVGAMDIATANNTVAIVMANPIAKEMGETYGISSRKTASILDTFSCVFQGIIPYGAQMLVAISAATSWGMPCRPSRSSRFCSIPSCFWQAPSCSSFWFPRRGRFRRNSGSGPRTTGSDGNLSPPLPVVRGPEPPATPAYADPRPPCRRPAPAMTLSLTRLRKSLFRAGGAPVILRQPHLLRLCRAVVVDHAVEQRADLVRVVRLAEGPHGLRHQRLGGHVAALEDAAVLGIGAAHFVHAQIAPLFGYLRRHTSVRPESTQSNSARW